MPPKKKRKKRARTSYLKTNINILNKKDVEKELEKMNCDRDVKYKVSRHFLGKNKTDKMMKETS